MLRDCFFDGTIRIEKIPISGRLHLVLSSNSFEGWMEELRLSNFKKQYPAGKILPPSSPQSIRAQRILSDIVQGMHSGLRLEKDCSVRLHECKNPVKMISRGTGSRKEEEEEELLYSGNYQKAKERIRKMSRKLFGWRFATEHLDGLNWELVVVDDDSNCNACYMEKGKILVFSGLLRELKSDGEVAAVLGHEVGHGIVRHIAESYLIFMWSIILLILSPPDPSVTESRLIDCFRLFNYRRKEMEADHIGLMLMASAGYDPQVMLTLHESRHENDPDLSVDNHVFASHPSLHERAKQLKEPKVMEQALAIYREVRSGLGVRSFV